MAMIQGRPIRVADSAGFWMRKMALKLDEYQGKITICIVGTTAQVLNTFDSCRHAQAEQQPRTQHVSPFSKAFVTLYELFNRHGTSSFAATVGSKQGNREERVGEWVV
jgi:hypothetical protein